MTDNREVKTEYVLGAKNTIIRKRDFSVNDEDFGERDIYHHPNMIGSSSALTDENGVLVQRYHYLPFGQTMEGPDSKNRYRFTGREEIDEIGLVNFDARWFDPEVGRFAQPDGVQHQIRTGKQLNRYVFVHNNPLSRQEIGGNEVGRWLSDLLDVVTGESTAGVGSEEPANGPADGKERNVSANQTETSQLLKNARDESAEGRSTTEEMVSSDAGKRDEDTVSDVVGPAVTALGSLFHTDLVEKTGERLLHIKDKARKFNVRFNKFGQKVAHNGKVIAEKLTRIEKKALEVSKAQKPGFFKAFGPTILFSPALQEALEKKPIFLKRRPTDS